VYNRYEKAVKIETAVNQKFRRSFIIIKYAILSSDWTGILTSPTKIKLKLKGGNP